ncbi:autotransporter domain-containing protein [Hyphomicrobium sp. LHD-15]|uniref:autotransporter outer membrane beta-barrel domain-containing protein n=1 Tax=Hyphomicrobium sp. LHD-15 TaxID=3072142 RepID=UPI00280EA63D|nr:autotransporter domain-containing protein [Hyphomicrobium sp. LHD-15]MDQ8698471.1 autotransporter domain-containing protein [Hyphomicrobium sp. LHD-15]
MAKAKSASRLKTTLLASAGLAALGVGSPGLATDWTGNVSSDWSNAANWSGGAPGSSVNAVIDATSPNAPRIVGGIHETPQLVIGQSSTGALTISDGTLWTGPIWLGYGAGASGTFSATGANSSVYAGGNLYVGYDGTGTVSLRGGAEFWGSFAMLGANSVGSEGTLRLDGPGTYFYLYSQLHVGTQGTGTLSITNGAEARTSHAVLGTAAGAVGTATIDGAGSKWTATYYIGVGVNGTGTLNVINGGELFGGYYGINGGGAYVGQDATGIGTLNVSGAGSLFETSSLSIGFSGTGVLNVTNGGEVRSVVLGGHPGYITIGQVAGSSGTVTVDGAGSLLRAEQVVVGQDGTGTLTLSNGGTAQAGGITVADQIGSRGTVNIGAASGSAAVAPGGINATTLQFGSGDGELVFNHTSINYTFGTQILGDGDMTVEAGTTVLSAANTYTGDTIINGGTLLVNGSTNSSGIVFVNPGGTLGGTGTVGSVFVDDGATLAPGTPDSIGTLTIDGVLMLCNCSTYAVKTGSAGISDSTVVTGVANLGGALSITPTTWIGATSTYTVLTAVGGTTGDFDTASVTRLGLATLTGWDIVGNDVIVTLDRGYLANALPENASRSAKTIVDAIDNSLSAGATPSSQMVGLMSLSGAALTDATTQVSGQLSAAGKQAAYDASNQFMNAVFDPFAYGRGLAGSSATADAPKPAPAGRSSLGAVSHEASRAAFSDPKRHYWGTVYGGNSDTNGSGGAGDTSSRTYGIVAGADYALSRDTLFGFALGGGQSSFGVSSGLGSGEADMLQTGVFGKQTMGAGYVFAGLAYTFQDVTTNRTVTVSGVDDLKAKFDANTFGGRVEGGYRYATPFVGITPYAALQVTQINLPGYEESAGSGSDAFSLDYESNHTTITRTELGARFDREFKLDDALLTLRSRIAWAHDEGNDSLVSASFLSLPGSAFTVNGAVPSKDLALVSAGAEVKWQNNLSVFGTFEGEFSENTSGYAGKGAVRFAW